MKADELPGSFGNASLSLDAARTESVLALYRKAFAEFTDEEMAILDGIILKPAT